MRKKNDDNRTGVPTLKAENLSYYMAYVFKKEHNYSEKTMNLARKDNKQKVDSNCARSSVTMKVEGSKNMNEGGVTGIRGIQSYLVHDGKNADSMSNDPLEQDGDANSGDIDFEVDYDGLSSDSDADCETWEEILENSRERTKRFLDLSKQEKLQEHFAEVRLAREKRRAERSRARQTKSIFSASDQRKTGRHGNGNKHFEQDSTTTSTGKRKVYNPKSKCHLCGYEIQDRRVLFQHYKEFHPEEKCFTCKYCQKHFRNSAAVLAHQSLHTGEKPFSCKNCGKRFTFEHCLRLHLRSHSNDVHVCKRCGMTFRSMQSFRVHNRKQHEGKANCTGIVTNNKNHNTSIFDMT